jgi:hypothetical protein
MPAPPSPPINISIQVSGKDMAASSGSFDGEIGKKQPGPIYAPEVEEEEEEGGGGVKGTLLSGAMDAAKTNAGGGLLSAAKSKAQEMALKKAMGGSGFTTGALAEFEPADRSPNWFVIILLVVMLGVVLTVKP